MNVQSCCFRNRLRSTALSIEKGDVTCAMSAYADDAVVVLLARARQNTHLKISQGVGSSRLLHKSDRALVESLTAQVHCVTSCAPCHVGASALSHRKVFPCELDKVKSCSDGVVRSPN